MPWRLQRDLAFLPGLRMRVHRIGLAHWQAPARLRSWGVAPLLLHERALHLPCAEGEALWLGAWLDEDDGAAELRLHEPAAALAEAIVLPEDFQITGLRDGTGRYHPVALPDPSAPRELQLDVGCGGERVRIALLLHAPDDWAHLAGRAPPAPLAGPPAPPPRYG